MRRLLPILNYKALVAGTLFVFTALLALRQVQAQEKSHANEVLPLIVMDEVPMQDAVKNLARTAEINIIFDPAVASARPFLVTKRWTNVTAAQALETVLKIESLIIVSNPVTTVSRITATNKNQKPVSGSQLGNDSSQPAPSIKMDGVLFADAVKNLAQQANLQVELDREIASWAAKSEISINWRKITPKQAMVALFDNYDLVITGNPDVSPLKVAPRKSATGAADKK